MFESEIILSDRYQLKDRLGQTAKGRHTWLCLDLTTQEKVALKLLAFSPEMQWEELKLFEREAQVLEALNHPRIPRYRDYFNIDKTIGGGVHWFALVQDYIAGQSLQALLDKQHRFTENQVRQIAIEVLEILVYLHGLSPPVLHRDIKPSNLILGEDDKIYLVDFGAVQAQASVTGVTFTVVGTSGYAPLEQFWGKAVFASDLYGLGATLIHLLTGISPANLPHQDYRLQFADKVTIQPHFLRWLQKMTDTLEKRFSKASIALKTLESPKIMAQSSEKIIPTEAIFSPKITDIKMIKTPHKLEIIIPAREFEQKARQHLWYTLMKKGGTIALIIFLLNAGSIFFVGMMLPFLGMLAILGYLSVIINPILSIYLMAIIITSVVGHLLMEYRLELTDKHLIIDHRILGNLWKVKSKVIHKNYIQSVILDQSEGISQVKIILGNICDTFGYGLTDEEAIWIVQNIQEYLEQ